MSTPLSPVAGSQPSMERPAVEVVLTRLRHLWWAGVVMSVAYVFNAWLLRDLAPGPVGSTRPQGVLAVFMEAGFTVVRLLVMGALARVALAHPGRAALARRVRTITGWSTAVSILMSLLLLGSWWWAMGLFNNLDLILSRLERWGLLLLVWRLAQDARVEEAPGRMRWVVAMEVLRQLRTVGWMAMAFMAVPHESLVVRHAFELAVVDMGLMLAQTALVTELLRVCAVRLGRRVDGP